VRTKIRRYREAYVARSGVAYAFLPCVDEHLRSDPWRVLAAALHPCPPPHIGLPPSHTGSQWFSTLSHCLTLVCWTVRWFAQSGDDHPSDEAFKFCRGQYFWNTRAAIGHATACAVAQRAHVAEHTMRRSRTGTHTQDDLLYLLLPWSLPNYA
jgi:hypothetical protein